MVQLAFVQQLRSLVAPIPTLKKLVIISFLGQTCLLLEFVGCNDVEQQYDLFIYRIP